MVCITWQRLGDDFAAGLVLYAGQETLFFGPRLRAPPVSALWELPPPAQNKPIRGQGD